MSGKLAASRTPMILTAGAILIVAANLVACTPRPSIDPIPDSWAGVETAARGATVDIGMWQGDPYVNAYMSGFVADSMRAKYGIELNFISAQGSQIVSALMTEKEAGVPASSFDMVWINGETFYQLRQIDALYGPFTGRLPNSRLVDYDDPYIGTDFQQRLDGFEAPWGSVQFAMIYDSVRVADPPDTLDELAAWIRGNPGRFTISVGFTGLTFLKSVLSQLGGSPDALSGPFDEETYRRLTPLLWNWLNDLKPYLWQQGRSFPSNVAQVHQLFASGEIWFTMSNNDGEVDNKVLQGVFQPTTRAYVPSFGSIRNAHYWGIVAQSRDRAAAMVTIDFLLSPAAQLRKLESSVWGDGTVLDLDRLDETHRSLFETAARRRHAPDRQSLDDRALREPAPEWMIRLHDDFRRYVIDG